MNSAIEWSWKEEKQLKYLLVQHPVKPWWKTGICEEISKCLPSVDERFCPLTHPKKCACKGCTYLHDDPRECKCLKNSWYTLRCNVSEDTPKYKLPFINWDDAADDDTCEIKQPPQKKVKHEAKKKPLAERVKKIKLYPEEEGEQHYPDGWVASGSYIMQPSMQLPREFQKTKKDKKDSIVIHSKHYQHTTGKYSFIRNMKSTEPLP